MSVIAIAGFQHETNSFSPGITSYADFVRQDSWPALTRGEPVIENFKGLNIPIGGFIRAASSDDLAPILWASAEPYGTVTDDAFDRISGMLCHGLKRRDDLAGIYLDLHGAMVVNSHEDGEAELLRRVRGVCGPDIPIAVSLDLHANISAELVEQSDVITIYRSYPHVDMAATGARTYALLKRIIDSDRRPQKAYRQLPYLIPLSAQHTGSAPCDGWYAKLNQCDENHGNSADIACGFPPSDSAVCGPAIVAYSWNDSEAERIADSLYDYALAIESAFPTSWCDAKEAAARAVARRGSGKPVVIADVQDNPGAGGTCDTTDLLRTLVDVGAQRTVVATFWDEPAVKAAHGAGVRGTIELSLGGRLGPDGVAPFESRFAVVALGDGHIECTGDMMAGMVMEIGPMALLRVDSPGSDVNVVVTGRRIQCLDQAIIRCLGVQLEALDIIALKSTVHFRADFESIADRIIVAACPGSHPCVLDDVPYTRLRPDVRLGPGGKTLTERENSG